MLLLDRIRRTIHEHGLAAPECRVVVALSGGSDSVALAWLLADLAAEGCLRLAGAAHMNHQLREAADADEAFCAGVAARLGVPFRSHREAVADRARVERRSLEDAARAARYEFLDRARRDFDADAIALGHTRDDQAETFLLRLLRGAGSRGLAAMHPRRGHFIRPLIGCRRAELRSFLETRGLPFVHDASNDDVSIPRNRVRAELLPFLEQRFNPSVVDALADAADIAREEWKWVQQAADEISPRITSRAAEHVWSLEADALCRLPAAVARAVVRLALEEAGGGTPVRFRHVEEALQLARLGGSPIDGPGVRMSRQGGAVMLAARGVRAAEVNLFRYPLSIPSEITLTETPGVLSAEWAASAGLADTDGAVLRNGGTAVLRVGGWDGGLAVRNRRPGDRFQPLGLGGRHKKLQDYFVDRKVAREARDRVPLVVDERDRILWVAGHGIGHEFRVTDPAQPVLVLRLRQG